MTDREQLDKIRITVSVLRKQQKTITKRLIELEDELTTHLNSDESKLDSLLDSIYDINLLLSKICNYYGIDISEIKSRKRTKILVRARTIFCKKAREKEYSLKHIGKIINRDHSTVIQQLKKGWV